MESIHKRIRRLREGKGLSQEALADLVGVKYQSVQEWEREKNGTAPTRKRQERVAAALGVTVHELMTGKKPNTLLLSAKEELLLEMFGAFTPEQQREQLRYVRALYDANRITQPMTGKPLRTISNEEVEAIIGKVPSPRKATARPTMRRRGGDLPDAEDVE